MPTLESQFAWMTQGLSPVSLMGAYMDWLVHLTWSPDKQLELVGKAQRKMLRLGQYACAPVAAESVPCIEPLPQDRRFCAPEWQRWPFNLIYQAFLLEQQWWYNATTNMPGVTRHHEQVWTFAMRQLLDTFAPSNFAATNPLVLAETWRRRGLNLAEAV
jgi:polyhydroxyalkanoate synthase